MRYFHASLLMAIPLWAQEPQAPPAKPPAAQANPMRDMARKFFGLGAAPDPQAVERGQKTYVANCGFCHGTNANGGNSGPDLVRSVLVLHDEGTGKEIGPVIQNGRPAKGMPKFEMTPEQIHDIAAFLLSRSQATANRMDYKILNIVTGDAKAGESYFNAKCATCHSPAGDLAHIAARYEPVALQSRFLYPLTRTFPGMPGPPPNPKTEVRATVTLPSGQKVSGVLAHLDDFNVALTDASGQYRSFDLEPSSGVRVELHDPLKQHEELLKQYSDSDMHNVLAYLETLK